MTDEREAFEGWFVPPGSLASETHPARVVGDVRRLYLDAFTARALLASLRAARRTGVAGTSAADRARALGRAGARFLDPRDPLRREAEARVPANAGLSAAMARVVIDGMARDWTEGRLLGLLAAELPDARALDEFVPAPHGRRVRAFAPELSVHVGSGSVPGVSATSLLRGLLVGSATLLKPGAGDVVLPVLLARAIAEESPELARACAVVYWPGGAGDPLEEAALASADLIVAYGGFDAVRALTERAPAATPVVAYHHRVSVALIGREALGRDGVVAGALARAVAVFDQRGCVSPQVVFVEEGGELGPRDLAARLADELARADAELPPGLTDERTASAIHQLRRTAELRAAAGEAVQLHAGPGVSWTVLVEPLDRLEPSCLGRTVRIHAVRDAREVSSLLAPWARHLQTVGVAGLGARLAEVAAALGVAGAVRVCPIEAVPFPPPWWHHDGQGPLTSLLRWMDLEE